MYCRSKLRLRFEVLNELKRRLAAMKAKIRISLVLAIFTSLIFGCVAPKKDAHFEFAELNSKPGLNIKGGKLGILAFQSVSLEI